MITYTTRENIGEYNEPPYWGINLAGETFLVLVDFDGQIIKGPVRSAEYLMNLSDDLTKWISYMVYSIEWWKLEDNLFTKINII